MRLEAEGQNGDVTFDGQYVVITRSGLAAARTVGVGQRRMHVSEIAEVRWHEPRAAMQLGYIKFAGPDDEEPDFVRGGPVQHAAWDEDAVLFAWRRRQEFEDLRDAVRAAVAAAAGPPPGPVDAAPLPAPPEDPTEPAGSLVRDLTTLGDLAARGILTPEEFDRAKERLLGR
ncbi:DUF4429 domain-containing protein [Streptomyces sp. NPDC051940]|uniref:DUF4429 domain-containing protein n=1 Tax=Streptomyces sp. NPDC051940 TaxID=3155675 RepID=UPI003425271F